MNPVNCTPDYPLKFNSGKCGHRQPIRTPLPGRSVQHIHKAYITLASRVRYRGNLLHNVWHFTVHTYCTMYGNLLSTLTHSLPPTESCQSGSKQCSRLLYIHLHTLPSAALGGSSVRKKRIVIIFVLQFEIHHSLTLKTVMSNPWTSGLVQYLRTQGFLSALYSRQYIRMKYKFLNHLYTCNSHTWLNTGKTWCFDGLFRNCIQIFYVGILLRLDSRTILHPL